VFISFLCAGFDFPKGFVTLFLKRFSEKKSPSVFGGGKHILFIFSERRCAYIRVTVNSIDIHARVHFRTHHIHTFSMNHGILLLIAAMGRDLIFGLVNDQVISVILFLFERVFLSLKLSLLCGQHIT